ncbi:unnamed protein product [Vicia faba]|uniref:non-specific serine/threonine protein kinase n=1 Tax=Vicia faba TaxID=3906 RepID=A0AAV0ZR19_VICFA|nr:unnamed protein product [Vicia faba]
MHRNTIGCKWIFKVNENEFGVSILHVCEEYAFTKALETCGFPVPNALEHNRHCVIMSLVQGYPLFQVKQLQNPYTVFETIIRLAENGIIHCDFNEFNIMVCLNNLC